MKKPYSMKLKVKVPPKGSTIRVNWITVKDLRRLMDAGYKVAIVK